LPTKYLDLTFLFDAKYKEIVQRPIRQVQFVCFSLSWPRYFGK